MRAGELDRRIGILRATATADAFNAPVETWSEVLQLWAAKRDVSDGERFRAGAMSAERMTRFQIRWSNAANTITPMDRVKFDGLVYDILAVKELERREGIEITASARVA